MKDGRGTQLPLARGLDAFWRARPEQYPRVTWLLMLGLDLLPWPWGEEILRGLFVAKALVEPSRLRQALRWAGAHSSGGRARFELALATCAHHGRVVARSALIGLRDPEQLRPHLLVRGEEHLRAAPRGAILLGFHLGMPNSDVALQMMGHAVTWLGGWRASRGWAREAWRPLIEPTRSLSLSEGKLSWGAVLARARQVLLEGGAIYMTADGGAGREEFRVPLRGGPLFVRSGWRILRDRTAAAVLPVLAHSEGRMHVVTIHPPLPDLRRDPDLHACREVLGRLLTEYVARFPEQCYTLAFRLPEESAALLSPGPSLEAPRA